MASSQEFIDTYSDDLLYLLEFRDSHLTHPGKKATDFLLNASLSRIFSAFMIGSIEAMIESWRERDDNNILEAYFIQGSNEQRISALTQNFKNNGINVDELVLKKYLAIKYLRNSLIHSSWSESQKAFVKGMGFPTDTRKLNESHLQEMYMVNVEMMKYIAATEHKEFSELKFDVNLPPVKRYFTKKQLAGFLWNNLERIDYAIIKGETLDDGLLEEIIYDWNLYKEITMKNVIDFDSLDKNIQILEPLVSNKQYSKIPIGFLNLKQFESSSDKKRSEIISALEKILNLKANEIPSFIKAFYQGEECYNVMINITVSSLLEKLAKIKSTVLETNLTTESILASKLFKLARLYYDYAENR